MTRLLGILVLTLFFCTQVIAQDLKAFHQHTALLANPETPSYQNKRVSTPEDIIAIKKLAEDFMSCIKNKDGKRLSTLVLHSRILFTSPGDQSRVDKVREYDVNFDGIGFGGFLSFSRYISTTTEKIEEKFYNIEITQDGHLAWVTFDYEFYADGKVNNYGIEHWQVRKIDGKWKIYSVIWTQYEPTK
ncbi:MAG: hypothetical protein FD167_3849 [bacterium]|nr:MAG: hypothetical protein FD167_3849 [bacterium]